MTEFFSTVGIIALAVIIGVIFAIGFLISENSAYIIFTLVAFAILSGIFLSIGTLFGGLYGIFWILESVFGLEDNPMEQFWNGYVLELV